MSKPEGSAEKKHEESKPKNHAPKPAAAKGKGNEPLPDSCHAQGCKARSKHFNFCAEHYDHFKFGLIKKTGEPVPDYDKKFEHFQRHVSKRAHKVA